MCVFVLAGLSYAYFTADIPSNVIDVDGRASEFEIDLITEEDGYIYVSGMMLIYEEDVEEKAAKSKFRIVTGNTAYPMTYSISFVDLYVSNNLQSYDFKWSLRCLNDPTKNVDGTFRYANQSTFLLNNNLIIEPNSTDQFELLIWIQESGVNQLELLDGQFWGKISVTASMRYQNP